VDDIRWIEAQENYVRICTGKDSHLLRETIGSLESRLDPKSFLRVHRSAIVNLHHVKEVKNESDGAATVVLKSGEQVPMSRSYRSKIQKLLKFQESFDFGIRLSRVAAVSRALDFKSSSISSHS